MTTTRWKRSTSISTNLSYPFSASSEQPSSTLPPPALDISHDDSALPPPPLPGGIHASSLPVEPPPSYSYSTKEGERTVLVCKVCQNLIDISTRRDQHAVKCEKCNELSVSCSLSTYQNYAIRSYYFVLSDLQLLYFSLWKIPPRVRNTFDVSVIASLSVIKMLFV